MRRLMWFAIGFAVACACGVWVLPANGILLSVLPGALLTLLGWKLGVRRLAAMMLGCSMGLMWYFGFMKQNLLPANAMDGQTRKITVTAVSHSYETDYGVGVDGEYEMDGRTWKIRLYVNGVDEICPGDVIEGNFSFRYTAPGGMRDPTYHAGDGILFIGYPRGEIQVRKAQEHHLEDAFRSLSYAIAQRLSAIFPEDWSPLARALLLGDDFDLDYETDMAFKLSGIRHIIAVSGLHVAVLYSVLCTLTLNRRFLTALIGCPVLFLFALAAGFTPSVTRACIMVGLMMLSQLIDREYDSPSALAFAGLVMLLWNPLVISSISFQMSFACVIGIQLFDARINAWLTAKIGQPKGKGLRARLTRWFISSVSISISAIVLTTPISAWYFGTVSLVGVLTNLLTLWAVSLSFCGILAALALSFVWLPAGTFLVSATSVAMGYVASVAKMLAKFPLAAVYTESVYVVGWLIFVYVLLLLFLMGENRQPKVLFCCAVIGLCMALLASWTEHGFSDVHLTALDVGQGQCIILHHEGKTFLIDCGGSNDEIAANKAADTLLSRGVTHLDGIILTHEDRDHAGGIPYLLSRIDTDLILAPVTAGEEYLQALEKITNAQVFGVGEDMFMELGGGKITVFGPTFTPESNENSLCVLFESENCDILVTGDRNGLGELLLLHNRQIPELELLIAGHHGSKYSTSEELLTAVSPEVVFISVGKNNAYGHPAAELLERLRSFGCAVYRTDLQGDLIFRR